MKDWVDSERVSYLGIKIEDANNEYRKGTPIMSDYEFDQMVEELKSLDPDNKYFQKGVHDKVDGSKKRHLTFPMYSLDKLKSLEEVYSWLNKIPEEFFQEPIKVCILPKFDGLSVQMKVNTGQATTRGDGEIGEDCTQQMSKVIGWDNKKALFQSMEETFVRGEALFSNENFLKLKETFPDYKNPRNTATGFLKGDFKETLPYSLMDYICYDCYNQMDKDKSEQLEFLNREVNSFLCPYLIVEAKNLTEPMLEGMFLHWKSWFPIDGLVISIENAKIRQHLGMESNNNPAYEKAYKHPSFSEVADTKILSIRRAVNRHGVVTPVCEIEPVELAGVTVSNVNGINMAYMYDWVLMPGQMVRIVRSGEVIPKIIGVGRQGEGIIPIPFREEYLKQKDYDYAYSFAIQERQKQFEGERWPIEKFMDEMMLCPSCGAPLSWNKTMTNNVCLNVKCEERKIQRTVDFFKIMGVENVGETTIKGLKKMLGIVEPIDFLALTVEKLEGLEGWGKSSAEIFVNEMQKLIIGPGVPLARYYHASGHFGRLGEKTLQTIIDGLQEIYKKTGGYATKEHMTKIHGVSDITAEEYMQGIPYVAEDPLTSVIKKSYFYTPKKEGVMAGEVFCFTGFRDADLKKQLEGKGATVSDAMTKKTTFLVVKDPNSTSSKMEKAKKDGINIIGVEELLNKLTEI